MDHPTAFSSSVPIKSSQTIKRCSPKFSVCATLAPQRPASSSKPKKTSAKTFHVLPENLPESERPPLPKKHWSVPVFGFLLESTLGIAKRFNEMRQQYGVIYRADYFLFPQTYVTSYQGVADILNNPAVFLSGGTFPGAQKLFGDDSLTLIDGSAHAQARALLAPAFSVRLMPFYFRRIAERTHDTFGRVLNDVAAGKTVKMEPIFREHYMGITIEVTTGVAANSDTSSRLRELFSTMQLAFFSPSVGPIWNRGVRARDEIRNILGNVVRDMTVRRADTIRKLREYGDDVVRLGLKDIARGDVDVLLVAIAESGLEVGEGASLDSEIVDRLCRQMLLLWFAGYATAAVTSTCGLFELGWNDKVRNTLIGEQDALVAEAGGDTSVTFEQVGNMPRLEAFLNEILRTRPAASGLFRRAAQDIEMHGKFIPKDSLVMASIKAAQMDPDVWPNGEEFDEERFLQSEGKPRPPQLLAFGGPNSPHFCIGAVMAKMMMKTAFATLLRDYQFTLDPSQSRKYSIVPEEVPASGVILEKFDKCA